MGFGGVTTQSDDLYPSEGESLGRPTGGVTASGVRLCVVLAKTGPTCGMRVVPDVATGLMGLVSS